MEGSQLPGRRPTWPWLLLVLLPLLVPSIPARAADEATPSIEAIRFFGNDHVNARSLRGVMRLQQPVWWNPFRKTPYLGADYLAVDLYRVLDLYRDRGFPLAVIRDVEVRLLGDGDKVEIDVHLDEGPCCYVSHVRLVGVEESFRERENEVIHIRRGDVLRRTQLNAARDGIATFYGEAGYLAAHVFADVQLAGDSADVIIRVTEGRLYRMRAVDIDTSGGALAGTKLSVVRREVLLQPGDIFRSSQVVKTQERIYQTGVFRAVRVLPVADSSGLPVADLKISAHVRNPGWYGFGAGYSSDNLLRLLAEWGNRNIAGKARQLQANGDISYALGQSATGPKGTLNLADVKLSYTEPWLMATRTQSTTSLFHNYDRQIGFDEDITGLEEQLARSTGRYSSVGLGLTNKWVRTGDTTSAGRKYVTRNLSASLQEDIRDNVLDPMKGSYKQVLGEYAGGLLGGRTQFSRWTLNGSWYVPLNTDFVLALRVRGGWIIPVGRGVSQPSDSLKVTRIPWEERFLLGGGTTVRGYRENSLGRTYRGGLAVGGTALALGNAELRFPLVWLVSAAVFLDAGNVWADPKEIHFREFRDGLRRGPFDPENVAYSAGGGLRFLTPVGPFRFDYGFKLGSGRASGEKKGEVHVSLGQAF